MMEKMAIIKHPKFGVMDRGEVSLYFETYTSEAIAAAQYLFYPDYETVLKDAGVDDVKKLDGMPCLVEQNGNILRFRNVIKIG